MTGGTLFRHTFIYEGYYLFLRILSNRRYLNPDENQKLRREKKKRRKEEKRKKERVR